MPRAEIVEITSDIVPQVCRFLAAEIGRGISGAEFSAAFEQRWAHAPSGFAVVSDGAVGGALLTIRSRRLIRGRMRDVCNLSSWATTASFRGYAPALLQRAIAQPGCVFTNFTASAAVVSILRAFRFSEASTEERVLVPFSPQSRREHSWTADVDTIIRTARQRGDERTATYVEDHRTTRAQWLLVDFGKECNVAAFHLMRAKQIPFAYILYNSAPHLMVDSLNAFRRASRQLWGWRLIAWPRAWHPAASGTVAVRRPQPILFKGDDVAVSDLDGLYSELTVLPILR